MNLKKNDPKETKFLSDAQANTNIRLVEMIKTIHDLKAEVNKEMSLKSIIKDKMKMELKNPII